ncbi:MAG TPA: hypothetical protein VLV88_11680 [Terriglobales bacterium]|nr:hypothetical protein [Terriglobales bacterium]
MLLGFMFVRSCIAMGNKALSIYNFFQRKCTGKRKKKPMAGKYLAEGGAQKEEIGTKVLLKR